jgi:hypothetical protein
LRVVGSRFWTYRPMVDSRTSRMAFLAMVSSFWMSREDVSSNYKFASR